MLGLMQNWPLTVDRIIRTTYTDIHQRARRLSSVLLELGIQPGDRVATLAWNTARHVETWYAVMGIGAVCHTLNPRLFAQQICYIINHAQDKVIFTDLTFLPILMGCRAQIPSVEHVVVMTDAEHMAQVDVQGALCYETLIEQGTFEVTWGGFDENTACGLCYTSGTTGDPKGVLYSHRSNFLHTLSTLQADVMGISARDVVLAVVPMFHANAWGLAFSCPAIGARLVLPGARMDGASIHDLLENEGVTFSAAVPTVWQMLLLHLQATGGRLTTLKRVVIGGSAVPEAMMRIFQDDYGVEVVHAWGMTETSPLGSIASPTANILSLPPAVQRRERLKQGRPPLGVELKLTDDQDHALPHDGSTFGRLKIKGPFIAADYYKNDDGPILDANGFFDTGDVATIDPYGFMQITDRSKDVIKSGGEWISSIEIENLAASHPKSAMAAVIGLPHPKWGERPLLLVKLRAGETATADDYLAYLDGKIARWWMPDDVVFVDEIPLGSTGKIDKRTLRRQFHDHRLRTVAAE